MLLTPAQIKPKWFESRRNFFLAVVHASHVYVRALVLGWVVLLNVLRCQLTYSGQKAETNAKAWFNIALSPRKPEGSLGRTAQDGHLDSHTAPELWR